MSRALLTLAVAGMLGGMSSAAATAGTITFETANVGVGFSGPVTEDGFTYARFSGALFVGGSHGNPIRDMEGDARQGGGILDIVRAGGGLFSFDSTDFAAVDGIGQDVLALTVNGYRAGSLVGTDTFLLATTAVTTPKYGNWTTELASQLSGAPLDDLQFVLFGEVTSAHFSFDAIDNVVLTPASAPGSLTLMFPALAIASLARRRAAKIAPQR
jgi:hypothetical protein